MPHEGCVGMAVTANVDHLSRRRFADISRCLVHRFQAHLRTVTAVASNTPQPPNRVDIRLVQLYRLRQVVHAKRGMAHRASLSFGLSLYDADAGREH